MARVLIIGDDEMSSGMLSRCIIRLGHEVGCADSREQELAAAGAQSYEVVYLDVNLPDWERFDSNGNGNPFVALEPAIDPLYDFGIRKGKEFIILALALDATGRMYRANTNASFSVSALMPTRSLEHHNVATDETFVIKRGGGYKTVV